MRRTGYLVLTGLLAVVGAAAGAHAGGRSPAGVWIGVGTAWLIQAAAFWPLAAGLERGATVLRVWIGGIAARFGGLALLWAGAAAAGAAPESLVVSYALALLIFLLVEAVWLATARAGRGPRTRESGFNS
ncbi:MAG: hypothetical protein ACE5HF_10175 [Gemmatimonadota bacterium]